MPGCCAAGRGRGVRGWGWAGGRAGWGGLRSCSSCSNTEVQNDLEWTSRAHRRYRFCVVCRKEPSSLACQAACLSRRLLQPGISSSSAKLRSGAGGDVPDTCRHRERQEVVSYIYKAPAMPAWKQPQQARLPLVICRPARWWAGQHDGNSMRPGRDLSQNILQPRICHSSLP